MLIENINIKYEADVIYKNFDIKFEDNKINCVIGKSGCGKTTLLNYIADELCVRGMRVAYIFQNDNLIPWNNVYLNLKLIAKQYLENNLLEREINRALEITGLIDFKYYYPNELSGGMKQRVNISRALLGNFDVILMDEPFKSLDLKCKNKMIEIFKEINIKKKTTIIIVTHDRYEVLKFVDNVFLLGNRPVKVIENVKVDNFKDIIDKII